MRFYNDKEIACEWTLNQREGLTSDKKEEQKFTMNPISGIIQPMQKQTVEITFTPTVEKVYNQRFVIKIKENPKDFVMSAKGQGTQVVLDLNPQQLHIGPILPYDNFAHAILEVSNNSEYDTELISLDFDQQYIQDEEALQNFDQFEVSPQLFFPVRQPGDALWANVKKNFDRKRQAEDIKKKLLNEDGKLAAEEKEKLEKRLLELGEIEKVIEYPKKVDEDKL